MPLANLSKSVCCDLTDAGRWNCPNPYPNNLYDSLKLEKHTCICWVCNFTVRLRLSCPFRKFSLLHYCPAHCVFHHLRNNLLKMLCAILVLLFGVFTTWWYMRSFVIGQDWQIIYFHSVSVQICISSSVKEKWVKWVCTVRSRVLV